MNALSIAQAKAEDRSAKRSKAVREARLKAQAAMHIGAADIALEANNWLQAAEDLEGAVIALRALADLKP